MVSLKKLLAVTAMGALMATPAFAQTTGGTSGGVGAGSTGAAPAPGIGTPGTTTPGGGLTPATPPSASPTLEPTPSTLPPRPTESTPAPGLDNPTGAIPGTLGSTPPGIGGATSTPVPQGGTAPSTTPGSSTIQR
jgi:hypothetical protein